MQTVRPNKPLVIAHRGACGYLPEHTFAAKALAYTMGADFLEQDVVATADDELVVLHDIYLDRVCDVAKKFPNRTRSDGRYYVRDFTLAEIRELSVHERTRDDGTPVYPGRFRSNDERFAINTFAEELDFIAELIDAMGRPVGIYPEIKRPHWHRDEGVDITPLFLDVLKYAGFEQHDDAVFVQCFDAHELRRIRMHFGSKLKLIQLIGDNDWGESPTDFDVLKTRRGLARLSKTVDGIGPHLGHLYIANESEPGVQTSGLVEKARAVGLQVHPYTFRSDDFPNEFQTFAELLDFCIGDLRVDGLFSDFPDKAIRHCANWSFS